MEIEVMKVRSMGIHADFFIVTPREVEETFVHEFPIGTSIRLKGIDPLALATAAQLLGGAPFKTLHRHIKPDFSLLQYSEFGEPDPQQTQIFLRQNYRPEELARLEEAWAEPLESHIQSMTGQELAEWVASMPVVEQFQQAFVLTLAQSSEERLQEVALVWQQELSESLQESSLEPENFFPFLQAFAELAQQALEERKHMYYLFSL